MIQKLFSFINKLDVNYNAWDLGLVGTFYQLRVCSLEVSCLVWETCNFI